IFDRAANRDMAVDLLADGHRQRHARLAAVDAVDAQLQSRVTRVERPRRVDMHLDRHRTLRGDETVLALDGDSADPQRPRPGPLADSVGPVERLAREVPLDGR